MTDSPSTHDLREAVAAGTEIGKAAEPETINRKSANAFEALSCSCLGNPFQWAISLK